MKYESGYRRIWETLDTVTVEGRFIEPRGRGGGEVRLKNYPLEFRCKRNVVGESSG